MASELQVCLFGNLKLVQAGLEIPLPASAHARLLLAYLLLNRDKAHPRLILAALLCPEAPENAARRTLNQALWQVRRILPELLLSAADTVRLSPTYPLRLDSLAFERLIQPQGEKGCERLEALQNLKKAVELYQGDLLEGFYEDWILVERARLRELYLQALERLALVYKSNRQFDQALAVGLCLAKADPLRESAHQEVMRLYHVLGRGAAGLQHYETYRALLHQELGLDPDPETAGLAREIARRSQPERAPYLPEANQTSGTSFLERNASEGMPLIGRAEEKRALLEMIEPAFNGCACFAVLEGEAGIGKTSLLQELRRELEWRGAQVLWRQAGQPEAPSSGDLLVQALLSGLTPLRVDQIKALLPKGQFALTAQALDYILAGPAGENPLAGAAMPGQRQIFSHLLTQILSLWSRITPLVIVLEDLQWAGEDSLETLREVCARLLGGPPVGVAILASVRLENGRAGARIEGALRGLSAAGALNRLAVHPLEREKTIELIRRYLGVQQGLPALEDEVVRDTGGNPLYVLEHLRLMYDQRRLARDALGDWRIQLPSTRDAPPGLGLSTAIESILLRRIRQLPPPVCQVLQSLAVLGEAFDFATLMAMCSLEPGALLAILRQLVQAQFLVETERDYHFIHDKLRQAAYTSIPAGERSGLHARAAEVIAAAHPEQIENLAAHYTAGQVWEPAARCHQKAGEEAIREHAYYRAAQHFCQALELAGRSNRSAVEEFALRSRLDMVWDILGDRSAQAGNLAAMQRLIEQHNLPESCRLEWLLQQIRLLYHTGQYAASEAAARQALLLAEGSAEARARALDGLGSALHGRGEDAKAIPHLQAAIRLFQSTGDLRAENRARRTLGVIYTDSSLFDLALETVQASTRLDRQLDDRSVLAMDLGNHAWILAELGELEQAEDLCRQALEAGRVVGHRIGEAFALSVQGDILTERGRLGQAIQAYGQAIAVCVSISEKKLQASVWTNLAGLYVQELGDARGAQRAIHSAEQLSREHGFAIHLATCQYLRAYLEGYQAEFANARRRLAKALPIVRSLNFPKEELNLRHIQASLEMLAGRPADALAILNEALPLTQASRPGPLTRALAADRCDALLALGRTAEANQALARVEATSNSADGGFRVPYLHFQQLRRAGEDAQAIQALAEAVENVQRVWASLAPEQQECSLELAKTRDQILHNWGSYQPRRVPVSLPRFAGRSTAAEEITILWTVWEPEDERTGDKVARRRGQLQRLLRQAASQGAHPSHQQLAEALGVSRRTIAQDLAELSRTS